MRLSLGTAGLAALWSVAGAVVWVNRREATRYGIVALLLAAAALLAWFDEVPGTLIALFMMAVLLTMAVRLPLTEAVENFASFMVTLLAALYVVQSMFDHGSGAILLFMKASTANRYQQMIGSSPALGMVGMLVAWQLVDSVFARVF